MTDLGDFKRLVYEPQVQALREKNRELRVSLEVVEARADTMERERGEARADVEQLVNHKMELMRKLASSRAEAGRLREALRFYADADNYENVPLPGSEDRYGVPLTACPIEDDCGEVARAALAGPQTKEQT